MKRLGYIILGVCLFLTGCKDSPRNHEEIKEDAIECVRDFIEDVYKRKSVSDKCVWLFSMGSISEIEHEFNLPSTLYEIIEKTGLKLEPQKVSYCNKVEEIREKGKLEYAVVRVKYKGKEILFHVMFCGGSEDNTGTAGEPKILETVGLVRFDNSSFSKKSGFTLEYDKRMPDITPYLSYSEAVAAQRVIIKQKGLSPDKVIIPTDIRTQEHPIWQVYCGDSLVYWVHYPLTDTPKIKRIIKLK